MMVIRYRSEAVKQLKKLPYAAQKKILNKISILETKPYLGKKLKGRMAGIFSLKIWPYRVIYEIRGSTIMIYSVAHRQGVYT